MSKSKHRKTSAATRKAAKAAAMKRPGFQSQYALKRAWLNRSGMWGWEVPEPKPWRKTA